VKTWINPCPPHDCQTRVSSSLQPFSPAAQRRGPGAVLCGACAQREIRHLPSLQPLQRVSRQLTLAFSTCMTTNSEGMTLHTPMQILEPTTVKSPAVIFERVESRPSTTLRGTRTGWPMRVTYLLSDVAAIF